MVDTSLTIPQGATRTIVISGIVDAVTGAALDVTTWAVRAQARQPVGSATILAEWVSGTPTGTQLQATATGSTIKLAIPHTVSTGWSWSIATLHVEVTEPSGALRRERVATARLYLDPEGVR